MRTEIHNEWKQSNELRDELYERFSDIEKLQGEIGDEADRRITAEKNVVSLKRQLEGEIDYRKFVEKIHAKEKYRADSLDIELHSILHDYKDFGKIYGCTRSQIGLGKMQFGAKKNLCIGETYSWKTCY